MPTKLKTFSKTNNFQTVIQADEDRAEDIAFYKSPAWRSLRIFHLRRCPLCADCSRPANEVHHIKNRKQFPELALDSNNLESLCKSCHSKRTAKAKYGRNGDNLIICGHSHRRTNWLAENQKEGDLIFDVERIGTALGFPSSPLPSDVAAIVTSFRLELFRLLKLEQVKRRCLVLVADHSGASQIAKQLGAEIIAV